MISFRKFRVLGLAAVATVIATAALQAPAQAAFPTKSYKVPYGNTYTQGVLTFSNRNVTAVGTLRVTAGNCRATSLISYARNGSVLGRTGVTSNYCVNVGAGTRESDDVKTVAADVAGGAYKVDVCLNGKTWSGSTWSVLDCITYYRP
ncbi:hypothetical protein [Paractinoplanes lichenicola]|uniref:Uncharacterized protein n=1 Tax=Paractinoplanes lichenicola TaxID=2802976 RepID=A0ABS1VZG4_9ACTN|nr:hypothetical protein [Actinoplanes lichenicola]MBL7259842.1 hypothetical protein [Actinoplanes lichenicola]